MPISGPVVHQQLMDAYSRVQADLQRSRGEETSVAANRERLLAKRSDSLVELAEHYLPELSQEAIRSTWVEIRPSIAEILVAKEQDCDQLRSTLEREIANRRDAESNLAALNRELDQSIEEQNTLALEVEHQLTADADFVRLADRAAKAEAALERAEANLVEIEQDSARKLPAYEESSLFQYLRDREFGTSRYTKRGFTRRMDRWIGKLVDYRKAKQSYDFLRETPNHMREIIAEDRDALNTVMAELEKRRDVVAEGLGLLSKSESVEVLHARRRDLLSVLEDQLEACNGKQLELNEAEGTRGPYYRQAIDHFRRLLEKVDTRQLDQIARSTAEISDDQIVARLIRTDDKMDAIADGVRQHHERLVRQQRFLEDLGRLIQRFRTAEFDSARSQFVGSLDILEELDRARDAGDAEVLWQRIRGSQRWGPSTMDRITSVATHPVTQVLINAMAHAAGSAFESHARRAGERRRHGGDAWNGPWGSGSWSGHWGGGSSSGAGNRR